MVVTYDVRFDVVPSSRQRPPMHACRCLAPARRLLRTHTCCRVLLHAHAAFSFDLSDRNVLTNSSVPRAALVNFVCPDALGSLATFKRVFGDPILRSRDRGASRCPKAVPKRATVRT